MLLMQMNLFGSMMSMKKYTLIAAMAAMAILAGSCAKEQDRQSDKPFALDQNLVKMHFTARTEGSPTKTTLNTSTGAVSWAAGDAIKMVWELDGVEGSSVSDDLSAGNISAGKAEFTAEVPDKFTMTEVDYKGTSLHLYAVYPSSIVTDYSDASVPRKFYLTVPTVQDGSFEHASIALAKWDKTNPSAPLEFKNLCGLLQIVIADDDVRKIVLHSSDYIAGKMQVSFTGPTVVTVNAGEKAITVNVPGAGTYYVAVLPTDDAKGIGVNNLYVELLNSSDELIGDKSTANPLVILRKQIRKLGTIATGISDRVFVTVDGGVSPQDGSTWEKAMSFSGLKTLLTTSDVTKNIYLASGTYSFDSELSCNATSSTFNIHGGYSSAAGGISLAGRISGSTIFDGNSNNRILVITKGSWEISGITFQNANATSGTGSALVFENSSGNLTLSGCIFKDNINSNASSGGGGAIKINCSGHRADIRDCEFYGNKATGTGSCGGAIFVNTVGTLYLSDSIFGSLEDGHANTAVSGGGAIHSVGVPTITRCLFSGNTAAKGGAINVAGKTTKISECNFIDNKASSYGGAIFNGSGGKVYCNACYFGYTSSSYSSVNSTVRNASQSGTFIGLNNCVFAGGWGGEACTQLYNSKDALVINCTMFEQVSAGITTSASGSSFGNIYNADASATTTVINSIVPNAASTGAGYSFVNGGGTFNVLYSLYTKNGKKSGTTADVSCDANSLSGISIKASSPNFPNGTTWYKSGATDMWGANQTTKSATTDARGYIYYYVWDGTTPVIDENTFTSGSYSEIQTAANSVNSDFVTWLGENLGKDIRGVARDTDAMWPGSYQGAGTKASIESLTIR